MSGILDSLFGINLQFTPNRGLEEEYASALNDVLRAEDAVEEKLSLAQWTSVKSYLEQIHKLQLLDCRLQFERGFLLGVDIMREVMSRDLESRMETHRPDRPERL